MNMIHKMLCKILGHRWPIIWIDQFNRRHGLGTCCRCGKQGE